MKIIQVSRACSQNEYNRIMKNDSVKTNQSILKFSHVMNTGFAENGVDIEVYSQRPVDRRNCNYKYLPSFNEESENIKYHYCRIFNIPIISKLYLILASFFRFLFARKEKDMYVLLDTYALALATGTLAACKLRRIPCIGLVTDLPSISTYTAEGKSNFKNRFNDRLISRCDGLILLTEQMNDVINPRKKKYIVVEGFASDKMADIPNTLEGKYVPRTIVYTGALDVKYGLKVLVDGFIDAKLDDCKLVIYGGGEYEKELIGIAESNANVVYGGTVPNSKIIEEQIKATLLVNPRFTSLEYNKYCFPGKNMEYMASGTPTLTTDLPGMPKEYKKYVFIIQEETAAGISDKLKEIMKMSPEILHNKGLEAKNWTLKEKGAKKQTFRIIEFLRNFGDNL